MVLNYSKPKALECPTFLSTMIKQTNKHIKRMFYANQNVRLKGRNIERFHMLQMHHLSHMHCHTPSPPTYTQAHSEAHVIVVVWPLNY